MLLKNHLLSVAINFLLLLSLVLGNDITKDTVTSGSVIYVDSINISSGVFWSIINSFANAFVGSLNNNGEFYITGNSGTSLSVGFLNLLSSTTNTGLIVFNSLNTLVAPTFSLSGVNFNNTGQVFFSGSTLLTSTYSISSSNSWYNGPGAQVNFYLAAAPLSTNYVTFGEYFKLSMMAKFV